MLRSVPNKKMEALTSQPNREPLDQNPSCELLDVQEPESSNNLEDDR